MHELPNARLDHPAGWRLVDLASIQADLEYAAAAMERAHQEDDQLLVTALWRSALIAYRRSFTGGLSLAGPGNARTRVPDEMVANLTDEERSVHDEARRLADKHIAHRVGDTEQGMTLAHLALPPDHDVVGIGPFMMTMVRDVTAFEGLAAVARQLMELLDPFIKNAMSESLKAARGQLDTLYEQAGL